MRGGENSPLAARVWETKREKSLVTLGETDPKCDLQGEDRFRMSNIFNVYIVYMFRANQEVAQS